MSIREPTALRYLCNKGLARALFLACAGLTLLRLLFQDVRSTVPGFLDLSLRTGNTTTSCGRPEAPSGCPHPPCPDDSATLPLFNGSKRAAPMDVSSGNFSFVHISKCAGSSWIRELHRVLPTDRVYPWREAGAEFSVARQDEILRTKKNFVANYRLISLRSPRHHVWSMFSMCKYGLSPRPARGGEGPFPNSGGTASNDLVDFDSWLSHFLDADGGRPEGTDYYGCYHPSNFQARYLTSTQRRAPHGVDRLPDATPVYEPDADAARSAYREQDWAALAEFFHESKCLLYRRLRPEGPEVRAYLDRQCVCPRPVEGDVVHVVHRREGHRSTLVDLPDGILAKVDALTAVDRRMYREALLQFLREVSWLESERELNRRVLCEAALRRLEPELAYLGINVIAAYHEARRSALGQERLDSAVGMRKTC